MQYLLVHALPSPAKEWVDMTKKDILKRFKTMDILGIPPHFTLKYYFSEQDLVKIETICESFVKHHSAVQFELSGFDTFNKNIIFLKVIPSDNMELAYRDLFSAIQEKNIPFDKNEINGIHFHVTLAANAEQHYEDIMDYLKKDTPDFSLLFDNLTILSFDGKRFDTYKSYDF
jgi:2'-5' RNA ligase